MGAPTVYRWDDANAPVARGEEESFIEILKACLVDGYGTKAAAGWTLEFENVDGTKAAFRNNLVAGTGMFLAVDGTYSTAQYSFVQAYETMQDEETGTGPFHNITVQVVTTSSTANTTPKPWVLVADDRCFYFVCWRAADAATGPTAQEYAAPGTFFGDIIPIREPDPWACMLFASTQSIYGSYLPALSSPVTATAGWHWIARNYAGDTGIHQAAKTRGGGPGSDTVGGGSGPPRADGMLFFSKPHINDGAAYTIRGWLPGFYSPQHNYADFDNFEVVEIDGLSLLILHVYSYTSHALLAIDTGAGFRP